MFERIKRGQMEWRQKGNQLIYTYHDEESAIRAFETETRLHELLKKNEISLPEMMDYLEDSGIIEMVARIKKQGRPTGVY